MGSAFPLDLSTFVPGPLFMALDSASLINHLTNQYIKYIMQFKFKKGVKMI